MYSITITGSVSFNTSLGVLTVPYGEADSLITSSNRVKLIFNGTLTGSCLAGRSTSTFMMGTSSAGNKVITCPLALDSEAKLDYNSIPNVNTTTNLYINNTRLMGTTIVSGTDAQISLLLLVKDINDNISFICASITDFPNSIYQDLKNSFRDYVTATLPNGYPANNLGTYSISSELFNVYEQRDAFPYVNGVNLSFIQSSYNWFHSLTPTPFGYNVTYDLTNCVGDPDNITVIVPNAVITTVRFESDTNYAFNSGSVLIEGSGFEGSPIVFVFEPETGVLKIGVVTSNITVHVTAFGDPYQTIDGESDIPGGDSIPIPSLPSLSAVTSGIIGLFNPTISQMQLLADYMWTDFGGTGSTTEDILKEIVQALKRSISNPLDYVIGLNIIPSAGLSVGTSTTIRFGFVSSNVSMPRLTSQYFVVDCGTLSFSTLCGDTFLDYAPYSKFSIYLPYIGVKDVDANDFVGHTIGVVYHGDVVTGGITAYVTKDGSVMYQYSGCCALNIPLTADNWGNTISGAVQIATALVTGGITGGSAGVASSAVKSVSSVAANPSLLSPQVSRSGAVSGGAGCMAVQKPFVIREAVRFHSTSGFNAVSGYPSYYFKALSEMHGYTVCYDVHLTGVPATENEVNEIENLLKEGVVF